MSAYTQGTISHFSNPSPNLHVAVHEAVHQLQHAGRTNDAGLGAERHAGAVADRVCARQPATTLIGGRGTRVPAAERNYTYTTDYGPNGRLADTGESLTFGGHEAFASASLISQSADILKARRSGISLSAGPETRTVKIPNGTETKTLSRLQVKMDADPSGEKTYGDCQQCAENVMGKGDGDTTRSAVVNMGGSRTLVTQPGDDKLNDFMAKIFFVQQEIDRHPNYKELPEDQKRLIVKKAEADYDALEGTKGMVEKAKLRGKAVDPELAKQLGIDRSAAPAVGEAFAIMPAGRPGEGQFQFHFASVIMATGADRITFENAGALRDQQTDKWKIQTYGPESKGQTFQDDWARAFGGRGEVHTVVVQNQPRAPEDIGATAMKPTADVMELYRKSTNADEKYYLKRILDGREVSGFITVEAQEDWTGSDEVFLQFGSPSHRSTMARIPQGTTGKVSIMAGALATLPDPFNVSVYEYDLLDPNDLIGRIGWSAPYSPKSEIVGDANARYAVKLQM